MSLDANAYVKQLKQLLPPGGLFFLEASSVISATLAALADEFVRVDARGDDLVNESDPRTATETIADWERVLSLPDAQVPVISGVLAERRLAVTQKYTNVGGQSSAFFMALALNCGYAVTIQKFQLMRAGFRVGDRVYESNWVYTMGLTVSAPAGAALSHADFERVIRASTHAGISVMFTYL